MTIHVPSGAPSRKVQPKIGTMALKENDAALFNQPSRNAVEQKRMVAIIVAIVGEARKTNQAQRTSTPKGYYGELQRTMEASPQLMTDFVNAFLIEDADGCGRILQLFHQAAMNEGSALPPEISNAMRSRTGEILENNVLPIDSKARRDFGGGARAN